MKLFRPSTFKFTNKGIYPSSIRYPGTSVFPDTSDNNGPYSNGDVPIFALSCIEYKTLNDWYIQCEFTLDYLNDIVQDAFIVVNTKEKGEQPFRVTNIEVQSIIRCKAYHVGFDTKLYSVELAYALNQTCEQAMTAILQATVPSTPFTVYSDITELNVYSVEDMQLYDALLLCAEKYNGYLEFNKFQIRIMSSIGSDKGLKLEYGYNLLESEMFEDWSNVVTKLKPIGNDGLILNPEWLNADVSYDKPYTKIVHFDSNNLEDLALFSQLYLDRWKVPQVNYKVKARINDDIEIGDIVQVKSRQFELEANVLSYKYDVITKLLKEVEFGNYQRTTQSAFEKLKSDTVKVTQEKIDKAGYIKSLADDEVVTVGENGDFRTINDALFYLSYKYPRFKDSSYPYLVSSAEIRLLSGFVMNEQVLVERMNLGFITITSEDAEVPINRSAISNVIISSDNTSFYPAFCAKENATLPVIGCLFKINSTGSNIQISAVLCLENSSATVRENCGVNSEIRLAYGCIAYENSRINADGSIFNDFSSTYFASKCSQINCNSVTTNGTVTAEKASSINCNSSYISRIGGTGITSIDSSIVNANSTTITNCSVGAQSTNASLLNLRLAVITNSTDTGLYVFNSANACAVGATITGSTNYSVQCWRGFLNVSQANCRKGGSDSPTDIYVTGGGIISASGSTGGLFQTANTISSFGIIFK